MIDPTTPISGPVPHVYVDAGDGRCVCGMERFVGLHVAPDCGHVEWDRQQVDARFNAIVDALAELRGYIEQRGAM